MAAFELGCQYWVYAPDGTNYISFNNAADPQYAGLISEVTGLDDGEVRESADVVPSGKGGRHHKFFQGRRPWTISGIVMPTLPAAARSATIDRIEGLMNQCLDADGQLQWLPSDGILRYMFFRKQLSTRITKGSGTVDLRFFIAGVAEDAYIRSGNPKSVAASGVNPVVAGLNNTGTMDAPPIITVTGPVTNPVITNTTTGKAMALTLTLAAGAVLALDMTQKWPSWKINGAGNYNGSVSLPGSDWEIAVAPSRYTGNNSFALTGTDMSVATQLNITWTDAWV